jgi:UDP-N-acetylmuramoylalanine--D-glutamate ligase
MASKTLSDLMRVRKETIRDCLTNFESEEHRLEKVLRINGVEYINDSKANNVNATFYALDSMEKETVWIVGDVDKNNDYDLLLPLVNEKVKAIICLGEDNDRLIQTFANVVDFMIETDSMEEAVKIAYKLSEYGDSVLFSPSSATCDECENYQERGERFKLAVKYL